MPDRRQGWVPLLEFAVRRGVSLSTLRRHIKSNKIQHRLENGKYYVFDTEEKPDPLRKAARVSLFAREGGEHRSDELEERVRLLEDELRHAQVEIAELKTLVALYEEEI